MGWSGIASVALHAGALAWLALGWHVEPPAVAAPIEIALLPPAPPPPPPPAPPEPIRMPELKQPEPLPEVEPLELAENLPELMAEEPLPPVILPKQRPKPPKPPKKVEPKPEPLPELAAAPPPAPTAPQAPAPAASTPTAAPPRPVAPPPSYLARLVAELERHKAYPRAAQSRRQQGTAMLRFTLTRDGHVADWRIERSSGHDALDGAVAAMIRKADPLPPLPPEIAGDSLDLVVPVSFILR